MLNASVGRVYGAAITETSTVNGKTTTSVHDVAASTVTVTSPENRTATLTYDPNTLLTESVSVPELEPTSYTYYNDGRVESVTTGTRVSSYTYDSNGHLRTVTDPEQRTTTYEYDIMGRLQWIDSGHAANLVRLRRKRQHPDDHPADSRRSQGRLLQDTILNTIS